MRMSKIKVNGHKIVLEKRRAARETIGKSRQPRSDRGTKRPLKMAPGVNEGVDDDDPLPAKKQSRGPPRRHDKDVTQSKKQKKVTTKKTPKKSKKSKLPPARPTSNEFILSEDDKV